MITLAVVASAIALFGLVPVRRLHLAGWGAPRLTAYWATLIVLGLLVAEVRGPARLLVPLFLAVYIAPFVTFRAGIVRLAGGDRSGVPVPGATAPRPPTRSVGSSGFDDADDPGTDPEGRRP